MRQIVRLKFPGLWNSEYPLVVTRLIDIVSKHDLEALHLQGSYDRLAAFRPQLEKIEVQERAYSRSAKLSELDQQRDTLFNIIYVTTKAFQRAPIADTSAPAVTLQTFIEKHGPDMTFANYTAETERLYDFVADVERTPEAVQALETLSLRPLFDRMKELNKQFDTLFMERHQEQAETDKVDIRSIRNRCDKAISALWTAIEFCSTEYGEEPYMPLVNAINQFNGYYKQQLAARATRRKNKDVSTENPIEPFVATDK